MSSSPIAGTESELPQIKPFVSSIVIYSLAIRSLPMPKLKHWEQGECKEFTEYMTLTSGLVGVQKPKLKWVLEATRFYECVTVTSRLTAVHMKECITFSLKQYF